MHRMGLTNTEIVKAREKKLRDCLLSPETEHIDSCFDSEDEGDACEVRQRQDTPPVLPCLAVQNFVPADILLADSP